MQVSLFVFDGFALVNTVREFPDTFRCDFKENVVPPHKTKCWSHRSYC